MSEQAISQQQAVGESAQKDAPEMPVFFKHLCWIECGMVCLIALGILVLSAHLGFWLVSGRGQDFHVRMVAIIKGMNDGWRVCLFFLIPMFFRPIFKFLIHLKEGPFGTKSGITPKQTPPQEEGYNRDPLGIRPQL